MRFSVVIPLYNKESHIAETMHSVFRQSFTDFELIVVDDGSTDKSLNKARAFKDPRLKVLSRKNRGTSAARNEGILAARGEYICFLDADDFWYPHFLTNINDLIREFPEAGIYCTAYTFKRKGKLYHPGYYGMPKDKEMFLVPSYFESVLYGEQVVTASSACIPQRVIDDIGLFNEDMQNTEDQEMWNRIVLKYRVAFHTEVSAIYRQDAQNMKTRYVPKQEIEYAAILQKQLDAGEVPQDLEEIIKKTIAANLIGVASLNLLSGDKKTARQFLNDPRANYFPERKAAWEKLMPLPSALIRMAYRIRNKIQNRR